jgi:hypothetical protein
MGGAAGGDGLGGVDPLLDVDPVEFRDDGPVEVCVPVTAGAVDPATAAVRREPAHTEAYVPVIRGHFEAPQILSIYDAARRWIRDRGLRVAAPPREVYRYPADLDHGAPGDLMCDVAVPYR